RLRNLSPDAQLAIMAPLWRGPDGPVRRFAGQWLRRLRLREDALLGAPPGQPDLAALQTEIGSTGKRVSHALKRAAFGAVVLVVLAEALTIRFGVPLVGIACPLSVLFALTAPAAARALIRRRLRDRLVSLSPGQQAEVLLPLRASLTDETRRLVDPLVR